MLTRDDDEQVAVGQEVGAGRRIFGVAVPRFMSAVEANQVIAGPS
jgi:hypothetical protein